MKYQLQLNPKAFGPYVWIFTLEHSKWYEIENKVREALKCSSSESQPHGRWALIQIYKTDANRVKTQGTAPIQAMVNPGVLELSCSSCWMAVKGEAFTPHEVEILHQFCSTGQYKFEAKDLSETNGLISKLRNCAIHFKCDTLLGECDSAITVLKQLSNSNITITFSPDNHASSFSSNYSINIENSEPSGSSDQDQEKEKDEAEAEDKIHTFDKTLESSSIAVSPVNNPHVIFEELDQPYMTVNPPTAPNSGAVGETLEVSNNPLNLSNPSVQSSPQNENQETNRNKRKWSSISGRRSSEMPATAHHTYAAASPALKTRLLSTSSSGSLPQKSPRTALQNKNLSTSRGTRDFRFYQ